MSVKGKINFQKATDGDTPKNILTRTTVEINFTELVGILGEPHDKGKTTAAWRFKIGDEAFSISVSRGYSRGKINKDQSLEDTEDFFVVGDRSLVQDVVLELLRHFSGHSISKDSQRNIIKKIV